MIMFDNKKKDKYIPGDVPPQCALSHNCTFVLQLMDKFEHLKRVQQEKTMKFEKKRRQLEEEIMHFHKMKASSETLQTQICTNIKKRKDHKKQSSLTILCDVSISILPCYSLTLSSYESAFIALEALLLFKMFSYCIFS